MRGESVSWSKEELADLQARRSGGVAAPVTPPAAPVKSQGTWASYTPGVMNGTEKGYSLQLECRRRAGEIAAFQFESVKLRLAKSTHYTPDFLVIMPDGTTEFHEVKGHWTDDARVKIKVAASRYPYYRFIAIKRQTKREGGGWKFEEFGA